MLVSKPVICELQKEKQNIDKFIGERLGGKYIRVYSFHFILWFDGEIELINRKLRSRRALYRLELMNFYLITYMIFI